MGPDQISSSQREFQAWDTSHPRVLTGKASFSTAGENKPNGVSALFPRTPDLPQPLYPLCKMGLG